MKPILFSVLIAFAAACGGSDTGGDTNNTKKIEIDKEEKQAGETTIPACTEDFLLECGSESVDGCDVTNEAGASLTLSHICLPKSETFAAAPCEQEIARVCEEGLVDACLLSPAASTLHVCVPAPADLEAEPAADTTEPASETDVDDTEGE